MAEDKLSREERSALERVSSLRYNLGQLEDDAKAIAVALARLAPKPTPMTDDELAAKWEDYANDATVKAYREPGGYTPSVGERVAVLRQCARMLRERGK